MTPEQLADMKTELRTISNLALGVHERAVVLAHQLEEHGTGCAHPKAKEATMMGATERHFVCPDCGAEWQKPWDAKALEGGGT